MEQLELFDVDTHYPEETTENFKSLGWSNAYSDYLSYSYDQHDCPTCHPYEWKIPLTDWSKS